MLKKIGTILASIGILLSILGLVTFSQFIVEESIQTVMFGTWAAQDAEDWKTVKLGSDLIKKQTALLQKINKYFGWIQPLAWISYGEYAKSAKYYTGALDAKILAHEPSLYLDETVTINIVISKYTEHEGFIQIHSPKIYVLTRSPVDPPIMTFTGVLKYDRHRKLYIDNR
jgi:hypothetical protein